MRIIITLFLLGWLSANSQNTIQLNEGSLLRASDIGRVIKTIKRNDSIFSVKVFNADTTWDFRYTIPTVSAPTWESVTGKPSFATVATTGVYSDLTGKPTIPTNNNQLTNGSGYLVAADIAGKQNTITNGSITNAQLANGAVANLSGTNTGDNSVNSLYNSLVSNATHTGDATGSTVLTVVKINGVSLAGLATGILKNTTSTGVPSIAVAGDFPTLNQNTTGTAGGLSANIAESQVTNLVSDLALKAPLASPTFTGTVVLPSSTVTNAMLAGSIDLATKVTGILPFSSNAGTSAATSATTGTMTVNMTTRIITITPSNACTFNASGGVTGQTSTFVVTTSGVSSFTLTWGTNYKTTGTLATGTTTAKIFCVTFLCTNGTQWVELSRTGAQ